MNSVRKNNEGMLHVFAVMVFFTASLYHSNLYSMPLRNTNAATAGDTLITDKDGNKYPIKLLPDNHWWTMINLSINIPGSYCYGDKKINCEQYGRLYTWEAAQQGCKLLGTGWHLPTNDEWKQLAEVFGGAPYDSMDNRKKAFKALIPGGVSQMNILLAGGRNPDGSFDRLEAHGFYWTCTENDSSTAWLYNFGKGGQFVNRHNDMEKAEANAVRCTRAAMTVAK